jgi:hypothetical protein
MSAACPKLIIALIFGTLLWPRPHSHANEQIIWMLNGKMFRLGTEQRVCGSGDVTVIP